MGCPKRGTHNFPFNPATIALNVNINDATGNDAMKPDNPAIPERTGSHTPHGWRLRYRS